MTTPRFREDNTEGYSLDDLAELNRRFNAVVDEQVRSIWGDVEIDELTMKSTLDHIAEQVLADFDAGG